MDEYFLERQGVLEEELSQVRAQISATLVHDESGSKRLRLCYLLSCRLHDEKTETW